MAGLLDFLQTPEAQMGVGLLAAGGPSTVPMNVGQRVQMALQGVNADKAQQMKLKLLQSQMDENASQNALRESQLGQQQRRDAYFMGDGMGSPMQSAPSVPGSTSPAAPVAGDRFTQLANQYKVPRDALVMDYMNNGGKGIAEMIAKRGTPDMQVAGNYAYDKNNLQPGYLPSLNISQDGKASQVQIGPDGQPVVSAPRGAVETFGAYQGQAANFKPIKVFNPVTQREEFTSEGAVVGQPQVSPRPGPMAGAPGNVASSGYSGGDRNGANAESIRMIQSELQKPGNSPADIAGMQREIERLQRQSGAPIGVAAGPSLTEAAQAEANKVRLVDTAKQDVVRDTATQKQEKSAGEMIAAVQRARELLKQGPTGSGIGEMLDNSANWFGKSTQGAEVAAKLDIVAGELVKHVPRMEGPQSDGDRIEYKIQAGRAADRKVPTAQRIAAMDEVERLQKKYAKLNGDTAPDPDKKASVLDDLPKTAPVGKRLRNTETGKIMRFDGLKWKEE